MLTRSGGSCVLAVLACISLCGCGLLPGPAAPGTAGPTAPEATTTVSIKRVQPAGQRVGEVIKTTTQTIDNCAGAESVTETLSSKETVSVSIEEVDGAKVSAGGTVNIGAFGSVSLGGEIAKQYGLTYGASNEVSDGHEVTVPAGSRIEYVVETRRLFETGEITLEDNGKERTFPYEILTDIKVDAKANDLGCSFVGVLQGRWAFQTWQERQGIRVLGVKPLDGTLVIDEVGHAYWDMTLHDGGSAPAITPSVRCLGTVDETAQTLAYVPGHLTVGGEDVGADQGNWTGNLQAVRGDVEVAFCGSSLMPLTNQSTYDTRHSDYTLNVVTSGDAASSRLLKMRNAAGVFTWKKTG